MNAHLVATGRLGADPEIRFTPNGKAVCELRVAVSNSSKDQKTQQYVNSPAIWIGVTLWETMATNAAETLRKGDELVISGQLEMEQFEKRDGTKSEKLILKFAEVAPSIRRGNVTRAAEGRSDNRPAAQRSSNGRPPAQAARPQAVDKPVDDPWATQPVPGGGRQSSDPPPF